MKTHRAGVRGSRELSVSGELNLLLSVFVLIAFSRALSLCVAIAGPFRTRGLARRAQGAAERISMLAAPPLQPAPEAAI